jgi:NAD(P)H-binding
MRRKPHARNSSPTVGSVLLSATAGEPMADIAAAPLSLFLLGATGRTGLLFLSQALLRGHFETIFVRSLSKLPAALASHLHLFTFSGELHEADKVAQAMRAAKPDVVYVMLSSETVPHTAVSTSTRTALLALRELRAAAAVESRPMPFISLAAWGLGPTEALLSTFGAPSHAETVGSRGSHCQRR